MTSFTHHFALADDKSFDAPSMGDIVKPHMKDGFGAEFWIVDDNENVERWYPEDLRGLQPALVTVRHKPLRLLVFLVDPGHMRTTDHDGNVMIVSDVTYDVAVIQPTGQIKDGCKAVTGWSGSAPSPHLMHVAKGTIKVSFEALDPLGTYTVAVLVHDNIRKVDIPLSHTIKLRELDANPEKDKNKGWNTSLGGP